MVLQQYLPFTVLKLKNEFLFGRALLVATVPTVYGIETIYYSLQYFIEFGVATVPTVYGIETLCDAKTIRKYRKLQQYLPFTVLKH